MPVATVSTSVLTVAPVKAKDLFLDEATELLMKAFMPDDVKLRQDVDDEVSMNMCGNCGYEGLDKTDGYFFCVECGHTKGAVLDTKVCDHMLASKSVLRGSKRQGIVAACVYFAFKKVDCVRSVGEVASLLDMSSATVSLEIFKILESSILEICLETT
ncbi:MAG: hypothetical protein FRX49_07753 [Trebouxia sp. A1-2]|nr:MAG: hypothetical protein FRX49_07753 [Trebouxia sp. A1-2]